MDFIDVPGVQVGFEERGSGAPLVLLHGLPGDSRVWRRQLAGLSDEYHVIAWDAPGCGRSSDPPGPLELRKVAEHLVQFITALELEPPHVVGLSWGGGLAVELFRIAPTLPRTLVLASAYAGWAGSLPADAVALRLDAYLTAAQTPPDQALQGWGSGMFSEFASQELIDELLTISSDYHPDALADLARSFAITDLRPTLPTISVPTLVLHGDHDARSPLSVGETLHEAIPGSTLVVLKEVGHVSNIEAPERFNDEVRRFLASARV